MKITYDKRVDALNVSIRLGAVAETVEIAPEVLVDLDRKGRVLDIEILGAREKVGIRNFSKVQIGNVSVPLSALA